MSMIGKTLAHYSITAEIGKGGMGEVYQAIDTKLGREVAIKVLPEEFAKDADRVARFRREAKLLASLNHPNIASIHGLEESDGTHFLVMELIEGETLAERIKSGPIPVEDALKLSLQISEALEAAHEKGVIHRDLKPANIKITPEGKIKVLDFGLAKAYAGDPADLNLSNSPTLSDAATQAGVILGTAAYMAPEQAKGKFVDKRADIWAFGVVVFEMLSGRQLFAGETVSETLAAVLMKDVDFTALPQNLHPRIREMLERCLQKDPKNRYGSIGDARFDMQKVLADPGGLQAIPAGAGTQMKSKQMLVWASATVILLIAMGFAVWNLKTPENSNKMEIEYSLPDNQQLSLSVLGYAFLAVSPDGSQFVYSTTKGLYKRSIDKRNPQLIDGSEDYTERPFFSPDGDWVGYYSPADRKLKKISINGGSPVPLCDIEAFWGGWWCPDNTIIFSIVSSELMMIPDSGGTPEPLIKNESARLRESNLIPLYPQMLPDKEHVLFTDISDRSNAQTMVQSIKTGKIKPLFSGQEARYSPTGHLLYVLNKNNILNLFAVSFDLDRLDVTGAAVSIAEGINSYAASDAGTIAYALQPGVEAQNESEAGFIDDTKPTLWWVDRNGMETPISIQEPHLNYAHPQLSPDGQKIVLTDYDLSVGEIWILDLTQGTQQRLTFNKVLDSVPIWSPDAKRIAYSTMSPDSISKGGVTAIVSKAVDGSGDIEYLGESPGRILFPYFWNKKRNEILVTDATASFSNINIGILSLEGEHSYRPLLEEDYNTFLPQLSPDGRWLAYVSNEFGAGQLFVCPYPDVDKGEWQISFDGGFCPRWSPDSKKLYYMTSPDDSGTLSVMEVEVETEPTFKSHKPKVLFSGRYDAAHYGTPYDVHPDGNRFLMIKPPQVNQQMSTLNAPRKIIILANWLDELIKSSRLH